MELRIYKADPKAIIPEYATMGSACFDLASCFNQNDCIAAYDTANRKVTLTAAPTIILNPGWRALIPTGLIFDIPWYHVVKIYPRSSTGLKKGLTLPNNVGIVDSDYVDPIYLLLMNISDVGIEIASGDRLCQAELVPVYEYRIAETVNKPQQKTNRVGGLGSTG